MLPYAVDIGDISEEEVRYVEEIKRVISFLPCDINGRPTSCHVVCRLVKNIWPDRYEVVDGSFGGYANHSWLKIRKTGNILDAYPVSGSNPIIWVNARSLFASKTMPYSLYKMEPLSPFVFSQIEEDMRYLESNYKYYFNDGVLFLGRIVQKA